MTRGPAETGHGWPGAAPRVGLGCMRLSTDEDRDEEARSRRSRPREAGITVFDTARAYGGNEAAARPQPLRACGARGDGADRDEGRDDAAGGGWVPDGRAKAIRADCEASLAALDGLPIDLYLAPRARSAHAVADVGARARPARRRGPRAARRRRERQPPAARRGARARARSRPSRSRSARSTTARSAAASSSAAPSAGSRVIAHSPLGGPARGARGSRATRRSARSRSAHGATPAEVALAWLLDVSPARRRDSRRAAAGDGALRARGAARLVLRDEDRSALGRAFGEPSASTTASRAHGDGRGRARDGHPRRRQEPRRRGVRRRAATPAQPRRARRLAARRSPTRSTRASRPARAASCSTTPTSPARRAATCSTRRSRHGRRVAASGSTRRSRRRRSTSSSGCSSASARCRRPRSCARSRGRAGRARADVADARRCASSSRRRPTRASRGVERVPFVRDTRRRAARTGVFVARGRAATRGLETGVARPESRPGAAPRLRLEPDGDAHDARRRRSPASPPRCAARSRRALPARRRPADLLVPAAAARAPARVRARARRRPGALDPRRRERPRTGRSPKRSARGTSRCRAAQSTVRARKRWSAAGTARASSATQ